MSKIVSVHIPSQTEIYDQAYGMLDGTGTPINSSLSLVAGKTRITLTWTYPVNVSPANSNGALIVRVNGQKVPRYVDATTTPDSYYKEISSNVIELDDDYSSFDFSYEVTRSFASVVDMNPNNSSNIAQNTEDISNLSGTTRNFAQNAEFRFWQRQDPTAEKTVTNDNYSADRWYALTSGSTGVGGLRSTSSPTSSQTPYSGKFAQKDAVAQRFGVAQILESSRVIGLRGKTVTISFQVKTDVSGIPEIRAGLLEWSGTADSVTSSFVTGWTSTPTLATNFSYTFTPSNLTLTDSWAKFEITTTISNSMNNLVLFFWTPNAQAQNKAFYITQVQLVQGTKTYDYNKVSLPYDEDLRECQRFYEKSYDVDTQPGFITNSGAHVAVSINSVDFYDYGGKTFKITKRIAPIITVYSAGTGSSGFSRDLINSVDRAAFTSYIGQNNYRLNGSGMGTNFAHGWHFAAEAEL